LILNGENNADFGAAEGGGGEVEAGVVVLGGGADDVEADAGAAFLGGVKGQFFELRAGPAGAAVADGDADAVRLATQLNEDFAWPLHAVANNGLHGVAQDVGEREAGFARRRREP
jgi:hypothetical protein